MSSSDPERRFGDAVTNIDSIVTYTAGLDEQSYEANQLIVDATEKCLARISEAAVKLGPQAEKLVAGRRGGELSVPTVDAAPQPYWSPSLLLLALGSLGRPPLSIPGFALAKLDFLAPRVRHGRHGWFSLIWKALS